MLTVYSNLKQTNFFAKENMYANFQNLDLKILYIGLEYSIN